MQTQAERIEELKARWAIEKAEREKEHKADTEARAAMGLPERNCCFYYSDDNMKNVYVVLRSAVGRWCQVVNLTEQGANYEKEDVITDYDKAMEYFNLHSWPGDSAEF